MPELPEVETVVRYLQPRLIGRTIRAVHLPATYRKAIGNCSPRDFNALVREQRIDGISRRAKFIVLTLPSGIICIHLRMTGRILLTSPAENEKKYVTAWFDLDSGDAFYFKDVRKFGRIYFYTDPAEFEQKLGIEPLSSGFTPACLRGILKNKKRAMKSLLLDQTVIAGIGNIYADEILWASKVHPATPAAALNSKTITKLHASTQSILRKSIEMNGTTFQSFYFGEEASGEFRSLLKVFGKQGTLCPRCSEPIIKVKLAQRGTHFCPNCQPAPDLL